MDHQIVSSEDQDDQLEQVPSAVGPGEQVARRLVAQLDPDDRVGRSVFDVLVGDGVAPS
ncbi:MAG TPA: hypothetical protein VFO01_08380 [Trebonia sp.]|nr:hypothetical protein [Trebonia sp.]